MRRVGRRRRSGRAGMLGVIVAATMTLAAGCYDASAGDPGSDSGPIGSPPPAAAPHVLRCDGVDDAVRVDIGDALHDAEEVTVELWLRAGRVLDWTEPDRWLVHGRHPSTGVDFAIVTKGSLPGEYRNVLGWVRLAETGGASASGSGWDAPLSTEWHHFALVTIATEPRLTHRIFWDGEPSSLSFGRLTERADVHPTEIVVCGAPSDLPFEGHVDQLRVSRIRRYRDAFAAPHAPLIDDDTVLILDFDGGEIADRSGHGWPIEVTGAPTLEPGAP